MCYVHSIAIVNEVCHHSVVVNIPQSATLEDEDCDGNREKGYENGRWMELAHDHVQWWALVLVVLNLRVLLP
jgi:hypothetical protein